MAYIDAATYASLTGKDASEATDARLKLASRLLDNRIGNYIRIDDSDSDYNGFKLNLDKLKSWQKEAVQLWVAWMTAALHVGGDAPDTFQQIRLGRFSVTENSVTENSTLPNQVKYADMLLRDAKIINTHVRSRQFVGSDCQEVRNAY